MGGHGGLPVYLGFGESKGPKSGNVVRSLKAWVDDHTLRGIQVEFTDETTSTVGMQEGNSTERFYLASGEKVSSLQVWGSSFDTGRCGGFVLKTDQGREFIVTSPTRKGEPYQPELGSGILVGVFGREGHDVDALGFALLRRVEKAQLINVEYPELSTLLVQTKSKDIKTITYDNTQGQTSQQFTFAGKESVITSSSWSITAGMEAGVETEVKAGFPILAEAKVKVTAKVSVSTTHSRQSSKTTEQSFSFPVTVPAGKNMQATATLYEGDIDTEYTANMVYTLDSGMTFQYAVRGTYNGVSASQAVVTYVSFTNAPSE